MQTISFSCRPAYGIILICINSRVEGMTMVCPQIICLNGTSSSGKTAIAKELQALLPKVYLNFSIDSILYSLPPSALARMTHG